MSAEQGVGHIYHPCEDPRYIEARLTTYQAKLVLIAACERQIGANEIGDPHTLLPQKILGGVSGDNPVVFEITHEVPAEDPLVSLLSRYGTAKLAAAMMSETELEDPLARSEQEISRACGEEALDFAEQLREDRAAFDECRFAELLNGIAGAA
jgi:hypothetical protein